VEARVRSLTRIVHRCIVYQIVIVHKIFIVYQILYCTSNIISYIKLYIKSLYCIDVTHICIVYCITKHMSSWISNLLYGVSNCILCTSNLQLWQGFQQIQTIKAHQEKGEAGAEGSHHTVADRAASVALCEAVSSSATRAEWDALSCALRSSK
jgi:hypothetical protein